MGATIRGISGEFASDLQQRAQGHAAALEREAERLHSDASRWYAEAARHRAAAQQLRTLAGSQPWYRAWITRAKADRESRSEIRADRYASWYAQQRASTLTWVQQRQAEVQRAMAGVRAEQIVVQTVYSVEGVSEIVCGLSFGPALGDIDVIALGSRALVLEVKAGSGQLRVDDDGTVYHGSKAVPRNPVQQCVKQLDLLRSAGVESPQGMVVFPDAEPTVLLVAGTGVMVIGGLDRLRQEVCRAMAQPPDRRTPNVNQLVQAVDRWLADKHAEMQQRLQTAYQYLAKRQALLQQWQWEQDKLELSDPQAMSRARALREKIDRAVCEQTRENENISWLKRNMDKWDEARRCNCRLVV